MTTLMQIDWLESHVTDILKRMEGIEFVTEGWGDIPTHTINSVHELTRAAFDLYFAIESWREQREKPTPATVVRIADYIGKNTTAHTQGE